MQIGVTLMTDSYNRFLGNRALSPETLMMGYGYDPFLSERSLKPPLFQTSTFLFRSAQDGKEFFELAYGLRQKRPNEEPRVDLQSDQQSRPRNARGSIGYLGSGRSQSRLRLGDGCHLDHALGLCAPRHRDHPFGPRLWRHRFPTQEDPAAIRCDLDRFS